MPHRSVVESILTEWLGKHRDELEDRIESAIERAVEAERERIARWLEANGQPGYAIEVRHLKP